MMCLSEGMCSVKSMLSFSYVFQPSIANATNIDTLLVATEKEDKMTAPPEALQDKIGFVFNNLSQLNLQTKVS
jgi:CCR4-NOT transcription complex subunit 1